MASFIEVPPARLDTAVLNALLEEYASRDGTDYGLQEVPLADKVSQLLGQLRGGRLSLLYDADSEQWDIVDTDEARRLLAVQESSASD